MNIKLTALAVASVGGGFACGYFMGKHLERQKAEEEIQSVKDAFAAAHERITPRPATKEEKASWASESEKTFTETVSALKKYSDEATEAKKVTDKPDILEYAKMTEGYRGLDREPAIINEAMETNIHVIAPNDFGMEESYSQVSLTYTSDGQVLDEDDTILEDVDAYVGMDAEEIAQHFGEYEDDSVFVINHETDTYYEILRSEKAANDF